MVRAKVRPFTFPAPVGPGDLVALVAPASPLEHPEALDEAAARLLQAGFKVEIGKNVRKRNGFIAGSDKERLRDFLTALRSKKVRALWCVRGGYGTGRLLANLPPALFRKYPKLLIGCSDITALHAAVSRARIISLHGPMVSGLSIDGYPPYTFDRLIKAMRGEIDPILSVKGECPEEAAEVSSLRPGRATGRLVGGNLTMLCSLLGTPYFPDVEDGILYLEDIGEAPYKIDRMLTQLWNAGLLQKVKGVAMGTFKNCEYKPNQTNEYRQTLIDVLRERFAKIKAPVVYGLPFGHVARNATIPNGAIATLDSRKGTLSIDQSLTS